MPTQDVGEPRRAFVARIEKDAPVAVVGGRKRSGGFHGLAIKLGQRDRLATCRWRAAKRQDWRLAKPLSAGCLCA